MRLSQAGFLTFKNFGMGESSNMNQKISGIFLNSRKLKETKETGHLKTENVNKTLIIQNDIKDKKQNDIKVTKTILPEEPTFIEPKKTFKRNCNGQNSS